MTTRTDEQRPTPEAGPPLRGRGTGLIGRMRTAISEWVVFVALLVLVGIPLLLVLVTAFTGWRGNDPEIDALTDPDIVRVIINTIALGVMVVIAATLMAAPLAFLMARTTMRRHTWIDIVVLIPFMTPPYISAMTWVEFTRPGGLAESLFGPVGQILIVVFSSPVGMAIVMAGEVFPFLYLLLRASFLRQGSSVDEAAIVHGAGVWTRIRRVLGPLSTVPFALGALLVFVRASGEFGTPVTLGNRIGFPVLVSTIHSDLTMHPINIPQAAALSSVLMAIGMTAWGLQQWFTVRGATRSARSAREVANRPWSPGALLIGVATAWNLLVLVATVLLPLFILLSVSTMRLRSQPLGPDNLTLDHYRVVLDWDGPGMEALRTSLTVSLAASVGTVALALVVTLVTLARRSIAAKGSDFLAVAPDIMPNIVVALGLILLWNNPQLPATLYNSVGMIIVAYIVMFLPLVIQNVRSSRLQISESMLDAARLSGAGPMRLLSSVVLPMMAPGIIAGWMLAFVIGIRELVASTLLQPPGMRLLSPWILGQFDNGNNSVAMAMTVVGVLTCTVLLIAVDRWRARMESKRG